MKYMQTYRQIGQVRVIVHERPLAVCRQGCNKASVKKALEECWDGYHELLELVTPEDGSVRLLHPYRHTGSHGASSHRARQNHRSPEDYELSLGDD